MSHSEYDNGIVPYRARTAETYPVRYAFFAAQILHNFVPAVCHFYQFVCNWPTNRSETQRKTFAKQVIRKVENGFAGINRMPKKLILNGNYFKQLCFRSFRRFCSTFYCMSYFQFSEGSPATISTTTFTNIIINNNNKKKRANQ